MKDNAKQHPRVLVLTSTFPRWENDSEPAFVFELCSRLTSAFDITVLSPRTPDSKKQENMAGVRVIRFPYFFQRWEKLAMHGGGILNRLRSNPFNYFLVPLFLLAQLWAVVRLLRKERFDLIHAHWLIPQGFIAVLGLMFSRRRIPLLCTSHGSDIYALRGVFLERIKRWIMDKSQALTVVSHAMKNKVVEMGVTPDKVKVISMGVDLKNLFTPDHQLTRSMRELLFVGRLVPGKGIEVLFKAMPIVIDKKPDIRLLLAGAGPLEGELRTWTKENQISDHVNFLGMVKQSLLPDLYRRAALAVFPFEMTKSGGQEGFGLVVVEAMGCECPVVAGDLPAVHDSITHEESGLIFPPGNVQALAESIMRLLDDSDLRFRLADEGRKRVVGKFDWEIIADKYCKLYDKLIKQY